MISKCFFDKIVSFIGLLFLWPVFIVVAILIKIKMPGGPVLFVQKRVGKEGELFDCHKFRTMTVKHNGSTISVAGDSRITPLGATLRHYKLDELPGLWDVLIGNMSFVGPRPDVPGYADKLEGDDRDVLKLRPGITGPATLKYRLEDEMIAEYVAKKQASGDTRDVQDIAVEYNDNVIHDDWWEAFSEFKWPESHFHAPVYADDYKENLNSSYAALAFHSEKNRDDYTLRCFEIPMSKNIAFSFTYGICGRSF